jgi:phosphatidylglycerol:prolipoprotein diacylglycerol transferase
MFDIPPDPIAFQIGPVSIGWYGICYAIGLAVAYAVLVRLARRAGEDPDVVGNGIIVVAVAALIGGRAYHVIDQWQLYANDPLKIILPPYSGLGVYGGIATGTLAAWWYARRRRVPFARWVDIIAPALFVMQAIGRWGNYFNQELYGPPTSLPWGIPIECAHRLQDVYSCSSLPEATTRFHPLFLYESLSGLLGAIFLVWLGYRFRSRLRPGDLLLVFFIWYGTTRFLLESLRADNWTFFGIPMAQIVSSAIIAVGVIGLIVRHRGSRRADRPPSNPAAATWGALGAAWMTRPSDESWANLPPKRSEDVDVEPGDDHPAEPAEPAVPAVRAVPAEPAAPAEPDAPRADPGRSPPDPAT